MTPPPPENPRETKPGKPDAKAGESRKERLKAALKANIARRKEQARARHTNDKNK